MAQEVGLPPLRIPRTCGSEKGDSGTEGRSLSFIHKEQIQNTGRGRYGRTPSQEHLLLWTKPSLVKEGQHTFKFDGSPCERNWYFLRAKSRPIEVEAELISERDATKITILSNIGATVAGF